MRYVKHRYNFDDPACASLSLGEAGLCCAMPLAFLREQDRPVAGQREVPSGVDHELAHESYDGLPVRR